MTSLSLRSSFFQRTTTGTSSQGSTFLSLEVLGNGCGDWQRRHAGRQGLTSQCRAPAGVPGQALPLAWESHPLDLVVLELWATRFWLCWLDMRDEMDVSSDGFEESAGIGLFVHVLTFLPGLLVVYALLLWIQSRRSSTRSEMAKGGSRGRSVKSRAGSAHTVCKRNYTSCVNSCKLVKCLFVYFKQFSFWSTSLQSQNLKKKSVTWNFSE